MSVSKSRSKLSGQQIVAALLLTGRENRYKGKWLPARCWLELIQDKFKSDDSYKSLDVSRLNSAVSNDEVLSANMDDNSLVGRPVWRVSKQIPSSKTTGRKDQIIPSDMLLLCKDK